MWCTNGLVLGRGPLTLPTPGSANWNTVVNEDPSSIPEPSDGKSSAVCDCNLRAEGVEMGDFWGPLSSQPSLFGEFQAVEIACLNKQGGRTLKTDA